jgi:hypothetical protein
MERSKALHRGIFEGGIKTIALYPKFLVQFAGKGLAIRSKRNSPLSGLRIWTGQFSVRAEYGYDFGER